MTFTLSTFVKLTGAKALREHLRWRGQELADRIGPEDDASALARLFKSVWPTLPPAIAQNLHQDFDRAEQFANEDAQAVLRSSCLKSTAALADLEHWSNDRARSLAILRSEPHLFEDAEIQLGVNRLLANRQLSAGFHLASGDSPDWSDEREAGFADRVREVYRKKAGVQRRLRLEFDRREKISAIGAMRPLFHQVTIYHEGDVNREPVFKNSDEVSVEERRPALMAALVFDPSTGTVEVGSKGGKLVQQGIADAFVEAFWPKGTELTKLKPANFALQRLKMPMHFPFRPNEGLRSIGLVAVVLKARGESRLDVTLRHPRPGSAVTLWDVADQQFGSRNPLSDPAMLVVAAEIRFEFEPGIDESKPKPRTIKLSLGNGSSKSQLTERQQHIVDEHLRQCHLVPTVGAAETATRTLAPAK